MFNISKKTFIDEFRFKTHNIYYHYNLVEQNMIITKYSNELVIYFEDKDDSRVRFIYYFKNPSKEMHIKIIEGIYKQFSDPYRQTRFSANFLDSVLLITKKARFEERTCTKMSEINLEDIERLYNLL